MHTAIGPERNMEPETTQIDCETGLARYDGFLTCWQTETSSAGNDGSSVSMALIDLDRFGSLNSQIGRAQADEVLRQTAGFLLNAIGSEGKVFRYGGDAFAIVMPGTEKEQAFFLIEKTRVAFAELSKTRTANENVVPEVTFSAGIATYPDDGGTPADVVRKASEAMYRAKNNGRNRVCIAREEKMVTKTSHYTQGQLQGLSRLAKRMGVGEAVLLREALDDLLRKYNA